MYKKPIMPVQYIAPLGLLLLAVSFIIKRFTTMPDFVEGFLKGLGIGMILFSLIYQWYVKRNEA